MGTSVPTRVNNTSEEEDYDGLPEEEEGITCYIRYCPKDNSYLQGMTAIGRATCSTTHATWRWMSARRWWRSDLSQGQ